ncbi:MAG: MarR family transcriptional regulator [Hydrocarboniphaga sp.]|uniref:MarR family winged helix-turn-helix transcriptional regulator n=1 Tax=Hydrocarboniphaga sp. TaxID=2033016 RepID=UPI002618903C|nr:MarR family transcriptional regulator [Hydrocarboniphaga sp.]MDB5972428.1 MarR family transcriptional regulator [Hydrocarboniphaga sp.]
MTDPCSTTAAPAATPAEQLASLMREVTRSLRANVDRRLEPMGLSQAQWRPLLALHQADGPLTQTELARTLEIEAPSLVRLLDRLADKNWIERRSAPGDRRVRQVFLTPSALELIRQILPVVHQVKEEAFARLSAAEIAACLVTLGKIRDNVRGPAPEG